MVAVLGVLSIIAAGVFTFAWTQFWDVRSKLRKELGDDLGLARAAVWGSHYAPALAHLFFDLERERAAIEESDDARAERLERLAQRIASSDILDQVARYVSTQENDQQRDDRSKRASALVLAQLFVQLEHEQADADEKDETERVKRLADRITRKDIFVRVEETYNLGQVAPQLESLYQQLGHDGTWAFHALLAFCVLLPASALFGLLPGADNQDTKWVAAITSWATLVALVFGVAAFFADRFRRRKDSLTKMLDEYKK
jgi:hypothetical protein